MYDDCKSKFDKVLEKDGFLSIPHINIQIFWTGCPHKKWMKSSWLNRQPHTIWGKKLNYIVEIPKHWQVNLVYGT